MGLKWLTPEHVKFLEEYEEKIQIKVNIALRDVHERQDLKQTIRLELIKAYKNRLKYGADWNNIVLGIINRRIIDYKKVLFKVPLFTTMLKSGEDDTLSFMEFLINQHHEENTDGKKTGVSSKIEAVDFVQTILSLYAWSEEEFDEWEQEYMERMYASYEENPLLAIDKESVRMELMGVEPKKRNEFRKKVERFTEKLTEILRRGED